MSLRMRYTAALRPIVERFPNLASTYREVRDTAARRLERPRTTWRGFEFIGTDAMVAGDFEREETELVAERFDTFDVFVDVGANVGLYSCMVGVVGKHVVALEPLQRNLDRLLENLSLNRLESVEIFPVGVASSPGIRSLFGASTGASLVAGWAGAHPSHHRRIAVNTLDNLLRGRFASERLFVKMDIEGGELDALRGAAETLRREPRPEWLVECVLDENLPAGHPSPLSDVFDMFIGAGYQARTADRARRAVTREDVTRWLRRGRRDFGGYNFLFSASPAS